MVLIVEGGVKQNLYLERGRECGGETEVDAHLSCPDTSQGEERHGGVL